MEFVSCDLMEKLKEKGFPVKTFKTKIKGKGNIGLPEQKPYFRFSFLF